MSEMRKILQSKDLPTATSPAKVCRDVHKTGDSPSLITHETSSASGEGPSSEELSQKDEQWTFVNVRAVSQNKLHIKSRKHVYGYGPRQQQMTAIYLFITIICLTMFALLIKTDVLSFVIVTVCILSSHVHTLVC